MGIIKIIKMDSKLITIVALAIAATGTMMVFQPSNTSASVDAFQAFKLKYNRAYTSSYEETYRFAVYV